MSIKDESVLNMNSIDLMKVEEIYSKKIRKASISEKFKLKCWLDYCKKNVPISFEKYLSSQTLNNFLDKLHYGLVQYDDIAVEEELEIALTESFYL